MKIKKIMLLCLVLAMLFGLSGCGKAASGNSSADGQKTVATQEKVRLYALKGPTALGLLKVFDDTDKGKAKNDYEYKIMQSPEEVVAAIGKGDFDLAALPANLAAVLFNKTSAVKVANINTLGVLYIASKTEVKSLEELKGKTLITSGKGSTPEYALRHLLVQNHIDPDKDLTIEFKSQHQEVLAALNQNPNALVLLPQPFLTVAMEKVPGLKVNLSLNDLWSAQDKDSQLVTGVLVVNPKFLQEHPQAFEEFEQEYRQSVEFVNDKVDEAAVLAQQYDIVNESVAKKAIKQCNIVDMEGTQMKEVLSKYLQTLFDQDPKAVGGKLPGDEFYVAK